MLVVVVLLLWVLLVVLPLLRPFIYAVSRLMAMLRMAPSLHGGICVCRVPCLSMWLL